MRCIARRELLVSTGFLLRSVSDFDIILYQYLLLYVRFMYWMAELLLDGRRRRRVRSVSLATAANEILNPVLHFSPTHQIHFALCLPPSLFKPKAIASSSSCSFASSKSTLTREKNVSAVTLCGDQPLVLYVVTWTEVFPVFVFQSHHVSPHIDGRLDSFSIYSTSFLFPGKTPTHGNTRPVAYHRLLSPPSFGSNRNPSSSSPSRSIHKDLPSAVHSSPPGHVNHGDCRPANTCNDPIDD